MTTPTTISPASSPAGKPVTRPPSLQSSTHYSPGSTRSSTANSMFGLTAAGGYSAAPGMGAERSLDAEWVRLALQVLPEEDRLQLLACEVRGLDWAAIATELEMAGPADARSRAMCLKPKLANLIRQVRSGRMLDDG